ncbi:MFS transporter [Neisseria leonii]|uniref:MFS transporter n=1 Tax=Neisseria leonii TaxID=2995413 RepID=A0A9X4E2K0_9NEIS|nr:MFS transporter [Neisseria sp. 51.81]MDD9327574.1 MFS transporter [Neisseria sp. 51.81]
MNTAARTALTLRQIMLMNFGFFGIQYSFALQQSAVNPIYQFLGANPAELPLLNAAGPVTGLIVQPIIGALSDRTWVHRLGRRRPYFLIGAIGCSIALFLFPHVTALWMAVLMLWLLDISNNTAMEPYRAFVADTLPENQRSKGFLMQSMFTGFGAILANLSMPLFQSTISGTAASGIPYWVYGSFYIGAFCSIGTVLISVFSTQEYPPSKAELAAIRAKPRGLMGLVEALKDITAAIFQMPSALRRLALVYLFQWYALFIYWQFVTPTMAKTVAWDLSGGKTALELAAAHTGIVNGFYNFITFIAAFGLIYFTRRYAAKYIHAVCVALAAAALLVFPFISHPYLLLVPMIGFGIAWASMMGIPFLIVTAEIPQARLGTYMGIINMMIVIPMLIQTFTFGRIFETVLGGDPVLAMTTAGLMLAAASVLTLFIRTKQRPEGTEAA